MVVGGWGRYQRSVPGNLMMAGSEEVLRGWGQAKGHSSQPEEVAASDTKMGGQEGVMGTHLRPRGGSAGTWWTRLYHMFKGNITDP